MAEAKKNPLKALVQLGYETNYIMDVEDACDLIRMLGRSEGKFKKTYSGTHKYEFQEGIELELTITLIDTLSMKKMSMIETLTRNNDNE